MKSGSQEDRKRNGVTSQRPTGQGVWTEYEDGSLILVPYKVDADGCQYVDLDPNNEIFR
jgi:hypothetical protein